MRKFVIAVTIAVCACTPRGSLTYYPEAASVGRVETVIVATSRRKVQGPPYFDSERAQAPNFALMGVSVPPERKPGSISYPPANGKADPKTDFLLTSAATLAGTSGFIKAINADLAKGSRKHQEATLFVHGFNTNFAEGLYRAAQLQHDMDRNGTMVFFSWPSQARALDYLADQDNAMFSRDALSTTIDAMARSNAKSLNLAAHSMGTLLLMDTLRTMALTGHDQLFAKLNAVVLISADLDIDLFRQEAAPVVARGVDIFVVTSDSDKALRLSAMVRGNHKRLGLLDDPEVLAPVQVTMINLSQAGADGGNSHFKAGTSPAILAFINELQASGIDLLNAHNPGLITNSVAFVQSGVNIVMKPLE